MKSPLYIGIFLMMLNFSLFSSDDTQKKVDLTVIGAAFGKGQNSNKNVSFSNTQQNNNKKSFQRPPTGHYNQNGNRKKN